MTESGIAASIMTLYTEGALEYEFGATNFKSSTASRSSRGTENASGNCGRQRQSWRSCGGTGGNGGRAPPGSRLDERDYAGLGHPEHAGRVLGPLLHGTASGPYAVDPEAVDG